MSKYYSKACITDGIRFASQKEAGRYAELKILEKAGHISDLELQPKFPLLDSFECNGERIRGISYVADFSYTETGSGRKIVEDVKGVKTEVYKIKKKLFQSKYCGVYDFRET